MQLYLFLGKFFLSSVGKFPFQFFGKRFLKNFVHEVVNSGISEDKVALLFEIVKINSLNESDQQYLLSHINLFYGFIQNQRIQEERRRQKLLGLQQIRAENARRNREALQTNQDHHPIEIRNERGYNYHHRIIQPVHYTPPPPPPRPFIERLNAALESLLRKIFIRVELNKKSEHFYCSLIDDDDAEEHLIIPLFFDENNEIDLNEHIVEITTDLQETSLIFIVPSANDFNGNTLNETILVIPNIGADINDLNIIDSISEIISIDNDDFAFKGCDKYYLHVKNNYIEAHSVKFDQWKSSFLSQEKK